jgi:predicted glycogen debranching enzyme
LIPVLAEIIDWHEKGTRYHIHADPSDGLLYGGQDGVQLTWMDAKVGDWVVTPRKGKPVEINALWYNALCIMDFLLTASGHPSDNYQKKATRVLESFNKIFWNEEKNFLYDVIDGEHKDDTIRPNAIYAVSLPFPLISGDHANKIVETVEKELLTRRGLRSLNVSHPDYHPVYTGDPWHRDSAYHQGTVWSFLLGAYIDALIKVNPDGKEKATALLIDFFPHLDEAGLGTVSEIFDGNAPHLPRGCIAQAWGVAEIFRVAIEYNLFKKPV